MIELYAVCSYSVGLKGLVNIYIIKKRHLYWAGYLNKVKLSSNKLCSELSSV